MTLTEKVDYYINHPSELYDSISGQFDMAKWRNFKSDFKNYIINRADDAAKRRDPVRYAAARRIRDALENADRPLRRQDQQQLDADIALLTPEQLTPIGRSIDYRLNNNDDHIAENLSLVANGIVPPYFEQNSDDATFHPGAITLLNDVLGEPWIYWSDWRNIHRRMRDIFSHSNDEQMRNYLTTLPYVNPDTLISLSLEDLIRTYYWILLDRYQHIRDTEMIELRQDMEAGSLSKPINNYMLYLTDADITSLLNEFGIRDHGRAPRLILQEYFDRIQNQEEPYAPERTARKLP